MDSEFAIVDAPLIEHIIDQADGREYRAGEYIAAADRESIAKVRMRVFDARDRGEPNIICAACHTPAYPRKHFNTGKFHFVHVYEDGKKDCPYNESRKRLNTGRIDSMRYNGQKEGPDHKRIKDLLRASIEADSDFDHKQIQVEKNWYGASDEAKWRRPDVAAVYRESSGNALKIAFEIQLSSTYLKVIAARRKFYLEDNALLFWIFKGATGINPRQYQDDLFYNNNCNIFVVDEETLRLSQKSGKLSFRCFYCEPVLTADALRDEWRERFVGFNELTIDRKAQRSYWFDYEGENARLGQRVLENEKRTLRERYEGFWMKYYEDNCRCQNSEYKKLKDDLSRHDVLIPDDHDNREVHRFNRLVFSAKAGKGIMTGLKSLLEVANDGYKNGREFMWYFGRVLTRYGNWTILFAQDEKAGLKKRECGKVHSSWKEKGKTIKQGYHAGGEFEPDRSYDKLFFFLFPEIARRQS